MTRVGLEPHDLRIKKSVALPAELPGLPYPIWLQEKDLADDTHPDCDVLNVSMVFAVSSTALDLTGASGRVCDGGDGQKLVAGGNGRLIKQQARDPLSQRARPNRTL